MTELETAGSERQETLYTWWTHVRLLPLDQRHEQNVHEQRNGDKAEQKRRVRRRPVRV